MTDGPSGREYDLTSRSLTALDAWHARRHLQQEAAAIGQRSREQRLDLARRLDVLREQHRAIVARTDAQLRSSARLLASRPRAVVVHRNAWFTDRLCAALAGRGVDVVARSDNGAEAVGTVVVEQPDLVLVEDVLPMLPGEAVVREVLTFAPRALVAAHVAYEDGIAPMLEAGARAAWVRRVPPEEVGAALAALVDPSPVSA